MVSGIAAALGTMGAMFGDIALTHLVESIGWRSSVYLSALAGIFIAFLLYVFIKDGTEKDVVDEVQDKQKVNHGFSNLYTILRNPQMWINGLIGCFIYLPTTAFAELWGIPFLERAFSFSPSDAAYGIFTLFLGFTIGAPISGMISDKLGSRRIPLLVGALGSAVLFTILLVNLNLSSESVYALLFFLGMLYSAQVIVFAIGREISPHDASGTAIAVTNMMVMLGGVLFQPIIGILLDYKWTQGSLLGVHIYSANDYQFALTVIPLGILLAAILTLFLKETHCELQD